eukprot:TRINITY_DN6132_c0_g1_i15.p1 TRINITY_DN6132_c0_g1~~TRINITY_DN6132_c0_g1_i15.p1  ORF type:complete len:117 (-),score=15.78 TRINITY_DN6132_c0_g1_i15:20-343(-)
MESYQSIPQLEGLRLKIQTITGQAFPVIASPTETIFDVKKKLEATPGIEVAPDRQRLFFSGTELADHLRLNEIPRLTDGSTIQIFLREIGRAVQQECRDRSRMPSSA